VIDILVMFFYKISSIFIGKKSNLITKERKLHCNEVNIRALCCQAHNYSRELPAKTRNGMAVQEKFRRRAKRSQPF